MYGVTAFSAVIHPNQAAILAVGAVREAVVALNGQPKVGRVMHLTLSADHRLLDGAYAAEFMQEVRHLLETPVRLLI
jgi:pyruvate dehydrogenase E2 component (dihydrolipoamide acetyltransferase)